MTELQIEKLRDIAKGLNSETRMLIMGVCFERDKLAADCKRQEAKIEDLTLAFAEQNVEFAKRSNECVKLIAEKCAELDRVHRERDAAVNDLAAVIGEIESIRQRYGIDNADADEALSNLCGGYCAACGKMCYKEGLAFRCDNFRWRGAAEGGDTK